jgi:DNA helicase MCM8
VDCCIPGDHITVYGIARSDNAETARGKSSKIAKSSGEHLLYVQASNVMNLTRAAAARDNQSSPGQGLAEAMSPFTENDYAMIREISSSPCPFYCLVASLCPGIFGQELVKAGLLLALLGGTKKQAEVAVRNDIHTLVVGDPGLGKSQLLKAVAAVAPRSVYVGSNTTKSGLTATVTKDGLEAGALVLADQGVCCIDEFDKLNCDHRALLEAMEQQQVSIAKSGIVASLSARCSVIAAANPIGGHYDRWASSKECASGFF